jgi:outer membrane receptor for ferrienterochelin and colicins
MNVKFTPGDFVIRGSYAKGFKAPSLKQLYLYFKDSNHEISGNENLLPEIANNFSLSADYQYQFTRHLIEAGISFFYNSSENAIQLAVDTARAGWGKYFNVDNNKYRTKGLETRLAYHFMQRMTLQVGYSLTGRSRIDDTEKYEYSGDIASSLTYQSRRYNYELAVSYKYSDDYLDFNGNFNSNEELNGIAYRSIDHYQIMDITLLKPLFQNRLTLSGGIKNLFDVKLVESSGTLNYHGSGSTSTAIGYGRTYFLKVTFQIDKF